MTRTRTNWGATVFVGICALFVLFPMYMTIIIAFKSPHELSLSALNLPLKLHWDNFAQAAQKTNFFTSLRNSVIITTCAVVLTLATNSMVGYAIARNMHKRFYKFLYFYFVSALFIPFQIIMLPLVKELSQVGLSNRVGLILLYGVYGLSFNVFVYVGYLKSIPMELEEAALIDGASRWGVFWRVVFPLLAPINATVALLTAISTWNDFLLPLVVLSNPNLMTLPLVQYVFQSKFQTNYDLAFASYLMALLPMIILYVVCQKWIIKGMMSGALK